MKKIIIAALLALTLSPFTGAGQEDPGALINRIKSDTTYLYGEATTSIRQEALVLARELLCRNIEEWYKEQGREETRAVIARDIVTGCEEITLMRGSMHRAFVYVKKSDPKTTEESVTVPTDDPKPATAGKPVEEKADAATKSAFPLDELCEQRSIQAVRTLLERPACKAVSHYGTVGRETRPADVESALLIIYSPVNGEVKSILDRKGAASKRRNLLTGQEDSNRNYPGCQALWLRIEE